MTNATHLLILSMLMVSSVKTLDINNLSKCLPLPRQNASSCQHLNYSTIRIPNSFGQTSYESIAAALDELESSSIANCSKIIEVSLCKAILPPCDRENLQTTSQNHHAPTPLCQQVCFSFKEECETDLQRGSGHEIVFKWPLKLSCNLLASCSDYEQSTTLSYRSIEVGYEEVPSDVLCSIENSTLCSNFLIPYAQSGSELVTVSFGSLPNCSEPCTSLYFSDSETHFARIWVMTCSLVCLLVSVFVFISYLFNYSITKHPAAPVYCISICYIFISFTILLCNTINADGIICDNHYMNSYNQSALIHDGVQHVGCALSFALVYYFTMAVQTWWLVLVLEWTVCSVTQTHLSWKWQMLCHVTGWGFPIIFVPSAFTTRSISADPVLRTCWITTDMLPLHLALDIGPLLLVLTIGSTLLLIGFFVNLTCKHPNRCAPSNNTSKIAPSLLARTNLYAVVILVLFGAVFCCQLYIHAFKNTWETSFLMAVVNSTYSSCYDSTEFTLPQLSVLLSRFTASMLVGIASMGWVVQKDIFCQRRCRKPGRSVDLRATSDTSSFYPSLYTVTSIEASLFGESIA